MFKITWHHISRFLLHTAVFGIFFIFILALFDNKNTMILTMTSNTCQPFNAEVYYTKIGIAFNDNKVSHIDKIRGNKYYFTLPDFKEINYARLDPARHKRNITIQKNVQIIVSEWFTTTLYTADITKSEVGQQIDDYQVTSKGIQFKTTGRDPQLNINLNRTFIHSSRNFHIDTLIMSLLIYLVIVFLYKLYKTEEFSDKLSAKLILYTLFLFFSLFKVDYYKDHVHITYVPDTIAHLSYIEDMHEKPVLFPKFENMYMITNKNAGNYLGHPPLYYLLMNVVYDKNYSVTGNIENFRMLNLMIFMASILLMLCLGFGMKMSFLAHFTYLTLLTSLPMHAYLGSAITNDNLAIFGGILFLVGFQNFIKEKYTFSTYLTIGLGIFIAFFSKLTAALLILFAGIFYILYMLKNKIIPKFTLADIVVLALLIMPVFAYQIYILLHYHAIVPTLNVTHPEEYLHSVYYIPEALRHYKTPIEWLGIYWHYIHAGWFGIDSFHSFYKLSIMGFIGLFILHLMAFAALAFKCNKSKRADCLLGKLSLLALITVSIIQVLFSYKAHLHSGYLGGLQPRYLLPFMVSFAIMASIFVDRFSKSFIFSILIILICIQALYSDFFYFLKYYA